MESFHEPMPATSSQREVLEMVDRMNADDRVDGILVQSPLPGGAQLQGGARADRPRQGRRRLPPAERRPPGRRTSPGWSPARRRASWSSSTATGRRDRGGERRRRRPIRHRRQARGAPAASPQRHRHGMPLAHARPPGGDPRADILIAAVGRPEMITGDMVKPGATVIDVGVNRTDDGLRGDVAFPVRERGRRGDHARPRRGRSDDHRDASYATPWTQPRPAFRLDMLAATGGWPGVRGRTARWQKAP